MRHSSRARTRGGKRPASLSRSISQSGCGKLPTMVVGNNMGLPPSRLKEAGAPSGGSERSERGGILLSPELVRSSAEIGTLDFGSREQLAGRAGRDDAAFFDHV